MFFSEITWDFAFQCLLTEISVYGSIIRAQVGEVIAFCMLCFARHRKEESPNTPLYREHDSG